MKKKIIAATLVATMMATGLGVANCSAHAGGGQDTIRWADVCKDGENPLLCAAKKTGFVVGKGFSGVKSVAKEVGECKDALFAASMLYYMGQTVKYHLSAAKNRFCPCKAVAADQAIQNLDVGFRRIKGQEEPKRKMRKAVDGIIGKKQMAKAQGEKYKRGDVIYLVGPSGVGKTFSAGILANALLGKHKPLVLSPANVDLKAKDSVVSQLFGMQNIYAMGFGGDSSRKEATSLVQYLKLNPNGVVIINEYDKMHSPALDEIFRTIMDEGEVNILGQKVDCSGALFIITSNESTVSASGANLDETKDDDGTGSRTHIKHDKAFMNRVCLVEFENLKFEDYIEVAKDTFGKIAQTFEKKYGMKVNVDGIIENAAKRAEKINQGSRPIVDDMSNGFVQILMEKRREDATGKNGKGKMFNAFYDADKDEFTLSEVNAAGDVLNTTTSSIVFQEELDEQIAKEKAQEEVNKPQEEKASSPSDADMAAALEQLRALGMAG